MEARAQWYPEQQDRWPSSQNRFHKRKHIMTSLLSTIFISTSLTFSVTTGRRSGTINGVKNVHALNPSWYDSVKFRPSQRPLVIRMFSNYIWSLFVSSERSSNVTNEHVWVEVTCHTFFCFFTTFIILDEHMNEEKLYVVIKECKPSRYVVNSG